MKASRHIKKPSSLKDFKDESLSFVLPPWFIHNSHYGPPQVRTYSRYSDAVMGAPSIALHGCARYTAPRRVPHSFHKASHQPASLCNIQNVYYLFSTLLSQYTVEAWDCQGVFTPQIDIPVLPFHLGSGGNIQSPYQLPGPVPNGYCLFWDDS